MCYRTHPPGAFHPEDIGRALDDLGETFDVGREDLDLLFRQVEFHAEARRLREQAESGLVL